MCRAGVWGRESVWIPFMRDELKCDEDTVIIGEGRLPRPALPCLLHSLSSCHMHRHYGQPASSSRGATLMRTCLASRPLFLCCAAGHSSGAEAAMRSVHTIIILPAMGVSTMYPPAVGAALPPRT